MVSKSLGVTRETREVIYNRTGGVCGAPGCKRVGVEYHHINRRSQYRMDDRHESWNIELLCQECHYSLHSQGNIMLDKTLKDRSEKRKPFEERSKNIDPVILRDREIRKKKSLNSREKDKDIRKNMRQKSLQYYKAMHDGLSPSQFAYLQYKKKYCKK